MSHTNRFGRLPEPPRNMENRELERYLNDLVRGLYEVNSMMFSDETGFVFGASRRRPFVEVSTGYSMGDDDSVVLVDSSASSVTVTLPTALEAKGTYYDIKKIDTNNATVVSVEGSGNELPIVLNGVNRPSVTLLSNGTEFFII